MAGSSGKRKWLILAMLFLFMLINFADKAVLGLAARPIMRDLRLTHAQFGQIGSSFFFLFSASAVIVGLLVERLSTKWVLSGMALVWGLVQLPLLAPLGVSALVANRIILGAGEGPASPMALHAIYKWFPDERRPLPTSLIQLGGAVGTGLAAPAITYVILTYSWRMAFGVLGMLGLAWVAAWLVLGREGPIAAAKEGSPEGERVPYLRLLTCRTVLGNVLLGFAAYWILTLAVVWLPEYLQVGAGYSPTKAGWVVTLPSLLQIITVPGLCIFSERLRRRGVSSRLARGLLGAGAVGLAGALLFALPFTTGPIVPILCTGVAFSCGATIFALGAVMAAEVAPTPQRGAVLGMNNAIATLAGVFAPATMGMVIDRAASSAVGFRHGFEMVGLAVVAAAVVGGLLLDPDADARRFARAAAPVRRSPLCGATVAPPPQTTRPI